MGGTGCRIPPLQQLTRACLPTARGQIPNAGDQLKTAIVTSLPIPSSSPQFETSLSLPQHTPTFTFAQGDFLAPFPVLPKLEDRVHLVEERRGKGPENAPQKLDSRDARSGAGRAILSDKSVALSPHPAALTLSRIPAPGTSSGEEFSPEGGRGSRLRLSLPRAGKIGAL